MSFTRPLIIAFCLSVASASVAQEKAMISSAVDKKRILIGEPLILTVEAKFSAGMNFSQAGSLPHFEWLQDPVTDSSTSNGMTSIKVVYKLTSFDSGHWVIPSFRLSDAVRSDTIGIDVVFAEFDPGQEYHDIKDIIEVKPARQQQWWLYAAAGAVLLALILIYVLRRRKAAPVAGTVTKTDPYEEAINRLEKLKKSGTGGKPFHSELTDIFRLYVFRKKGILSLQKTTDDLVVQLKNTGFAKDDFEKLSQSLRLSDFVKFAKYDPPEEDNNRCYDDIINAIKTIEGTGAGSPASGEN